MNQKLTLPQKIARIKLANKIIAYAEKKGMTITAASKHYGKNKRFVYDVLRRYVNKNGSNVPKELKNSFKKVFKPKRLKYKAKAVISNLNTESQEQ